MSSRWAVGLIVLTLVLVGCTPDYAENCFARASTGSGQESRGDGEEGQGTGNSSGKSDADASSGCSRTPVN